MLELRPDCERCGCDLPPGASDARVCTFECTFCAACVDGPLAGTCPNCGGNFEPRPIRPANLLDQYPPSTVRKGPAQNPSPFRGCAGEPRPARLSPVRGTGRPAHGGTQAEGLGG